MFIVLVAFIGGMFIGRQHIDVLAPIAIASFPKVAVESASRCLFPQETNLWKEAILRQQQF
jgi:hypothetical protein